MIIENLECCAVKELNGIQEYEFKVDILLNDTLGKIEDYIKDCEFDNIPTFFIYTTTNKNEIGDKFKELIESKKLGIVKKSSTKKNLNSGNLVTVYLWEVNIPNFEKCIKLHDESDFEDDEDNLNW